ncbi:MAG: 4Fe-4S dicluster domain-containing protein, partial [Gemmobacter sp.]
SAPAEGQGDCIDCMACVNVCPMGIDIRNGQQLACITCGLCIDACNDVMDRIGRPRDLIGYLALTDETAERAGRAPRPVWQHVLRPRTILYTVLWAAVGVGLTLALFLRPDIDVNVTPVRNPTFVTLSDGAIRNTYDIRLRNLALEPRRFAISAAGAGGAPPAVAIEGAEGQVVTVGANETAQLRLYLVAPPGSTLARTERSDLDLWVQAEGSADRLQIGTIFNGNPDAR